MDKNILITEKPSVAMQMAKALKINKFEYKTYNSQESLYSRIDN